MPSLPYMKLYVSDLIGDTTTLSAAEFGAYMLILCAMWNANGELSMSQVRRASRLGHNNFPKVWRAIADYFEVDGDRVSNARLTEELERAEGLSEVRSQAAKGRQGVSLKGVSLEKDTLSGVKSLKNKDQPTANADYNHSHSHSQKKEKDTSYPSPGAGEDWPKGGPRELLWALAERVNHPWLDPRKDVTQSLHRSAVSYLPRWRDAGVSWERDVIPTVEVALVSAGSPVSTLKFFDNRVLLAHGQRTSAKPDLANVVSITGDQHARDPRSFAEREADHHASQRAALGDAFARAAARRGGGVDDPGAS